MIGPLELHRILVDNLCPSVINTNEFDAAWTLNMYGQVVWQLMSYQQFFKLEGVLSLQNVLYQLQKKLRKEFIDVKKSFFQKVLFKEQALANHVVLLVTNIIPSMNPKSRSCILELSDGAYSLPAYICVDKIDDHREERFDCDKILIDLIERGSIKAGDKFHFYGLFLFRVGLPGHNKQQQIKTEHYFLNNCHNFHLKININGFSKADHSMRIGEQEIPFFRKCLSRLSQFSKAIPCLDVFVVKKYTPYYLEEIQRTENEQRSRFIVRNRRTMDRLQTIRSNQIEAMFEKETDKMRQELEK